MLYELPLNFPIGEYITINEAPFQQAKKEIEHIESLEGKLEYFNKNIRSLSIHEMSGEIYLKSNNPEGKSFKIYCGCNNCRNKPDFDIKNEQIYFDARAKEVKRIQDGLNALTTYEEKLTFLLRTKGYSLEDSLNAYANHAYEGNESYNTNELAFDLTPQTQAETVVLNDFVKNAFNKKYTFEGKFSANYKGFRCAKEVESLNNSLADAIDKIGLLEDIRIGIEKYFNYPESIKIDEETNNIIKKINKQLEENYGTIHNQFAKMVRGIKIDLYRHRIYNETLLSYTHIEQIVRFYRYVLDSIKLETYAINQKGFTNPNSSKPYFPLYERWTKQNTLTKSTKSYMEIEAILKWFAVRDYDGYKSPHTLNEIGKRFFADLKEWLGDNEADTILEQEKKLSELDNIYQMKAAIRGEYERRLTIAPDKKTFRLHWIAQVEKDFCVGTDGIKLKNIERRAVYVPFWDVVSGFDRPIKHYAYLIYDLQDNNKPDIERFVFLMAVGFAFAHLLHEVKQGIESVPPPPNDFKNVFCKSMPLDIPKNHFAVFASTNSKDGNPFLTEKQLNDFIERAFCGISDIAKQTFNIGSREKLFIVKRFYEMYSSIAINYENIIQCKEKYIRLLTDNFTNWEYEDIKNNFGNKVKRNW